MIEKPHEASKRIYTSTGLKPLASTSSNGKLFQTKEPMNAAMKGDLVLGKQPGMQDKARQEAS